MTILPLRYARWMARDLFLSQGIMLLVIAVLTGIILARISPRLEAARGAEILTAMLSQLGWLFVLYLVGGMVSTDRVQGYYRSYFSRPVPPWGYYLQRWLLGGVVMALMIPVLYLAVGVVIGWIRFPWELVAKASLLYLLFGGLCFFLSTLTRLDWTHAIVLYFLDFILYHLRQEGAKLSAILNFVADIIPPFHLTDPLKALPAGVDLFHCLAYGLALVLAALAVLRWRPMGVGGRS